MVLLDNIKNELTTYKEPLREVKASLDLDSKTERVIEIEREMQESTFWDNVERANKISTECKAFKKTIEDVENLEKQYNDIFDLIELAEDDESMAEEIEADFVDFKTKLENLRISTLLTGEHDANNAILRLNAGAGGTESCDWVSILYRMYTRWAEKKGYQVEVLDYLEGDEAGIKSVAWQVNGPNAYGFMKGEKGVHRLVRISPFNAQGKRQTSFASLDVMPELENDNTVEINPEDLKIDTYRSSGAGGQHINKTSSAVRITHIPTGVVVACQNERSQFQNKDKAMQMLKAKLLILMEEANAAKLDDIRGEIMDNAFGSQIRSYVLQPYTMVKDTRTNEESSNAGAVLDGDLDQFINAYLKWKSLGN